MRGALGLAALLAAPLAPAIASADVGRPRATVAWAKGLVTATGVGVADRRAPSPDTARGAARRRSIEAAKQVLRAEVAALPWAGGGTVGSHAAAAHAEVALDAAVDRAVVVDESPFTDGSWRVTLAVPIEALRVAVAGPRVVDLATSAAAVVPVLIVEVASATGLPAVGLAIGDGTTTLHPAVVFDAVVPGKVRHVRGMAAADGTVRVDGLAGATDATLVVVMMPPGRAQESR